MVIGSHLQPSRLDPQAQAPASLPLDYFALTASLPLYLHPLDYHALTAPSQPLGRIRFTCLQQKKSKRCMRHARTRQAAAAASETGLETWPKRTRRLAGRMRAGKAGI